MIRNKRGDGCVQVCLLTLILSMILSVFVAFAGAVQTVRIMKENAKTVLESYLIQNAIRIYGSIKQGEAIADSLDEEPYLADLASFCTLEKSGEFYYHKDTDGRTDYYISRPTVGFAETGSLKLNVSYTIYIPIRFDSVTVETAVIPTTVRIDLNQKW